MKSVTKKRLSYLIAFIILLGIEICIGLFMRDSIIRPYGGDVLVVILLYCLIRIFIPEKCRLLSLYIFLFACAVEFAQLLDYASLFGFEEKSVMRVILGSSFSWYDILCYALGCAVTGIFEFTTQRRCYDGKNKSA